MLVKNIYRHSTTTRQAKAIVIIALALAMTVIGVCAGSTFAEEDDALATVYAICDPRQGNWVSVRLNPTTGSQEIGRLECGDKFSTDGEAIDGWIRCYGIGECSGWVFSGFTSIEKPQIVMERYCCVAKKRVAVRRWQGGPQIRKQNGKKLWLNNCEDVTVFCIADGWACTGIGYVQAEWLEVDPL